MSTAYRPPPAHRKPRTPAYAYLAMAMGGSVALAVLAVFYATVPFLLAYVWTRDGIRAVARGRSLGQHRQMLGRDDV